MTSSATNVVLLAIPGRSTNIVFHALAAAGVTPTVVLEEPISRWTVLRRRVRRLGAPTVIGQVLFIVGVLPVLRWRDKGRVAEICTERGLVTSPIDVPVHQVSSANASETQQFLARLQPTVVVINGTRILSPATLNSTEAPFLNMHAGVTPTYRGVHGGYWALADGRPELAGTTVHYVDRGIDTGAIVGQALISAGAGDSFVTYPYLQIAAGLPILLDAVDRILSGDRPQPCDPLPGADESRLRSHPTLWGYLGRRARSGVA